MPPPLDVLIVGAGPTGLTLGCELAARGIAFRLIDKLPAPATTSRALVLQARSLELLQKHGLAEGLVERGMSVMRLRAYVGRRQAAEVELTDIGANDTPYAKLLFLSQVETESALERRLEVLGARVERGTELTALSVDGAPVAELRGPHGNETLRPRFVVGCDGAHSAVRRAGGFDFEGAAYDQQFMLADVRIDWELPGGTLFFFFGREGQLVVFPLAGEKRFRLLALRREGSTDAAPTLAEFEALVADRVPVPAQLSDPVWLAQFRLHHRAADHYRRGPLFLAGDAAHIHSPAGGQGMNTGIQDAFNLGWKLARACQGHGGELLLDSYEAERLPVGRALLKTTDRLFETASSQNPLLRLARERVIPAVGPWVVKDRSRRERVFRFISELAISYRGGPAVLDDHAGPGPLGGDRAPDGPVPGGTLFDLLRDPDHHLLCWARPGAEEGELRERDEAARALQDALGTKLQVHKLALAEVPELAERYGVRGNAMHLVRPDGYLAGRTGGFDAAPLIALYRRLGH
jgi:2-polyprenyl-6-methoxyphenol hydroxylase-like FAD-dependent oxidoreductase